MLFADRAFFFNENTQTSNRLSLITIEKGPRTIAMTLMIQTCETFLIPCVGYHR